MKKQTTIIISLSLLGGYFIYNQFFTNKVKENININPNVYFEPCKKTLFENREIVHMDRQFYQIFEKKIESGKLAYHIIGDEIVLNRENFPSLARDVDKANTNIEKIVIEARKITVDMPLNFDKTSIELVGQSVIFKNHAEFLFLDDKFNQNIGVNILTENLDLTAVPNLFSIWKRVFSFKGVVNIWASSIQLPSGEVDSLKFVSSISMKESNILIYGEDEVAKEHIKKQVYMQSDWLLFTLNRIKYYFTSYPYNASVNKQILELIEPLLLNRALYHRDDYYIILELEQIKEKIENNLSYWGYSKWFVPRIKFDSYLNSYEKQLDLLFGENNNGLIKEFDELFVKTLKENIPLDINIVKKYDKLIKINKEEKQQLSIEIGKNGTRLEEIQIQLEQKNRVLSEQKKNILEDIERKEKELEDKRMVANIAGGVVTAVGTICSGPVIGKALGTATSTLASPDSTERNKWTSIASSSAQIALDQNNQGIEIVESVGKSIDDLGKRDYFEATKNMLTSYQEYDTVKLNRKNEKNEEKFEEKEKSIEKKNDKKDISELKNEINKLKEIKESKVKKDEIKKLGNKIEKLENKMEKIEDKYKTEEEKYKEIQEKIDRKLKDKKIEKDETKIEKLETEILAFINKKREIEKKIRESKKSKKIKKDTKYITALENMLVTTKKAIETTSDYNIGLDLDGYPSTVKLINEIQKLENEGKRILSRQEKTMSELKEIEQNLVTQKNELDAILTLDPKNNEKKDEIIVRYQAFQQSLLSDLNRKTELIKRSFVYKSQGLSKDIKLGTNIFQINIIKQTKNEDSNKSSIFTTQTQEDLIRSINENRKKMSVHYKEFLSNIRNSHSQFKQKNSKKTLEIHRLNFSSSSTSDEKIFFQTVINAEIKRVIYQKKLTPKEVVLSGMIPIPLGVLGDLKLTTKKYQSSAISDIEFSNPESFEYGNKSLKFKILKPAYGNYKLHNDNSCYFVDYSEKKGLNWFGENSLFDVNKNRTLKELDMLNESYLSLKFLENEAFIYPPLNTPYYLQFEIEGDASVKDWKKEIPQIEAIQISFISK